METRAQLGAVPRSVIILATLALLTALAAGAIAMGASTRPTLPPPFDTAGNGLIAFQPDEHHVHYFDPTTGKRSLWLRSDTSPSRLAWSPDGTRLAFAEDQPSGSSISITCVPGREACGSLPAERFVNLQLLRWSPDGSTLLVVSEVGLQNAVTLVPSDASDGASAETLDLGMRVDWATWHPDGTALLVKGIAAEGAPTLFIVPLEGAGAPEPILSVDTTTSLFSTWGASEFLWDPSYSPDGSTILYSTVVDLLPSQEAGSQNARVRMVDADGTDDRLFEVSPDSTYEIASGWSPDGTHVAISVQHDDDRLLAIAPVDDATRATIVGPDPSIGNGVSWSPDGTLLLTWGADGSAAFVEAATGALTPLETRLPLEAAWQPLVH
jgi:Tol biopolymer transport system component